MHNPGRHKELNRSKTGRTEAWNKPIASFLEPLPPTASGGAGTCTHATSGRVPRGLTGPRRHSEESSSHIAQTNIVLCPQGQSGDFQAIQLFHASQKQPKNGDFSWQLAASLLHDTFVHEAGPVLGQVLPFGQLRGRAAPGGSKRPGRSRARERASELGLPGWESGVGKSCQRLYGWDWGAQKLDS